MATSGVRNRKSTLTPIDDWYLYQGPNWAKYPPYSSGLRPPNRNRRDRRDRRPRWQHGPDFFNPHYLAETPPQHQLHPSRSFAELPAHPGHDHEHDEYYDEYAPGYDYGPTRLHSRPSKTYQWGATTQSTLGEIRQPEFIGHLQPSNLRRERSNYQPLPMYASSAAAAAAAAAQKEARVLQTMQDLYEGERQRIRHIDRTGVHYLPYDPIDYQRERHLTHVPHKTYHMDFPTRMQLMTNVPRRQNAYNRAYAQFIDSIAGNPAEHNAGNQQNWQLPDDYERVMHRQLAPNHPHYYGHNDYRYNY